MEEKKLDGIAEDMVNDLIGAKEEMMLEEDGTRGLFSPSRRPAALPQYDEEPEKRQSWMDKNKAEYIYDYTIIPGVPMLENVPKREEFSAEYLIRRGLTFVSELFKNEQLLKIKKILDPFDDIKRMEELFMALPEPTSLAHWNTDQSFAEQRLSGPNPVKIKKIRNWDEMPFKAGERDELIPGFTETWAAACDQGALYISDYTDLSFIVGRPGEKYVPTPIALFYWSTQHEDAMLKTLMGYESAGELIPIAIQIRPDIPLYFHNQADQDDWQIAKWCVQIADGNDHQLRAHWTLTHMVMEPFGIATERQLAHNHPLGMLLRPHFRFMVYNNNAAVVKLLSNDGWIDQLMGGKIEESIQIALNAYEKWTLQAQMFPNEIAARHMDDTSTTPHYPYRDDGMKLWAAVKKYVKDYLRVYYKKRQDLENDAELQAWAAELASKDGGRVAGMPGQIKDLNELIDIITTVIFTCGPQHAAVNYAQYDFMGNVINMPLGAYCPFPPTTPVTDKMAFKLKFLPPSFRTTLQLKVAVLLSSFRFDRLGFYKKNDFEDPQVLAVIEQFQKDLEVIEKKIMASNLERRFPYEYMKPSQIINSISI